MSNDTAKCIALFWCLYAFVASGFEHSVANMPLFSIAFLAEHPPTVTLAGLGWNLVWVTIGNTISGAGIMGARLLGSVAHAECGRAIGATSRRRTGPTGGRSLPVRVGAVL